MNFKKQAFIIASALMIFLSACKKDVVAPEEQQPEELATVSSADAANNVPETAPAVHTQVVTYVNNNVAGFYQSVPARYNLTTKKYPLILFIHGIGELGYKARLTQLNCCGLPSYLNKKTFPAEFIVNGERLSFIVMSPQFKYRPSPAEIQSAIDFAKKRFRVDETRVYVTGLSMGGGSTWDWASVYGQNAAAVVPVCGGTAPNATMERNIASKNLPVYAIHTADDKVVPVSWSRNWISQIGAYNPAIASKLKLTVWPTGGHNGCWMRAFNPATREGGKNLYEWMLQYKRTGTGAPIVTPVTPPVTIPTTPPVKPPVTPPTTPPVTPPTTNQRPIAIAGPDQVIPVSWKYFPTLNAFLSKDPDGYLVSLKWTKVSGPASYAFVNANVGSTKVNRLTAGVYVFRITATDNKGATSTDDVQITMK